MPASLWKTLLFTPSNLLINGRNSGSSSSDSRDNIGKIKIIKKRGRERPIRTSTNTDSNIDDSTIITKINYILQYNNLYDFPFFLYNIWTRYNSNLKSQSKISKDPSQIYHNQSLLIKITNHYQLKMIKSHLINNLNQPTSTNHAAGS